uniref:hypothetical protein n=5 Tax=Pseudomonadati TaxID=3379134 RepID=UPI00404AAC16
MAFFNLPLGHPMGVKINEQDLKDDFNLDTIVELTKTFHGGKYVIGYDTQYVENKHYHIHWYTIKTTNTNAMKTFRTNVFKKANPELSKSFRYYAGKDLPSASPTWWVSYAVKETVYRAVGIEITPEMDIERGTILEIKKLKKVKSETLADKDKEKKKNRHDMYEYVKYHFPNYYETILDGKMTEHAVFVELVVQYMISLDKYGGLRMTFIRNYWIEWKCKHSQEIWNPSQVAHYIQHF